MSISDESAITGKTVFLMAQQLPLTYTLACSIILQVAAAIMAFRLIGITGRRMAWAFISVALTLMAVRRIIPLYHLVSGNPFVAPDFLNESIGLVLSLMMVAMQNLLENAWKFTARQPLARIEFGVSEMDGKPAYFVRDNGAGFDMAYADRLFTPFQRLHKAEEFPGTGIGLALVQRIIHRHGGEIRAEGAADRGAAFYFTLAGGRYQ